MVIAQRGLSNNSGNKFCERMVNVDMQFQTQDSETTLTCLVLKELGLLPPIPWQAKGYSSSKDSASIAGSKFSAKEGTNDLGNYTNTGRRRSVASTDQKMFCPYSWMRKCYSRSYEEHERLVLKLGILSKVRKAWALHVDFTLISEK